MQKIDHNGNITLSRGEVFTCPIFIDVSPNMFYSIRFPFHEHDEIIFNICEPNVPFEKYLLSQTYRIEDLNENKDVQLKLIFADTAFLCSGTYYYEIKLHRPAIVSQSGRTSKDFMITLVPRRKFIVL